MTHLLRSLIRETLLLEEVYGAQAVVYHGTGANPQALIDALLKDKFIPGIGSGAMYGKGLYTVYDLNDTLTERGTYGKYIIKLKVNLYGYIIFDPDIALKVYKKQLTPAEQAEEVGYNEDVIKVLRSVKVPTDKFTSDSALKVHGPLQYEVKGIVFTGSRDGRVAVVYDPTTAVPMAWKQVGSKSWTPVDRAALLTPLDRPDVSDREGRPVQQSALRRSAMGDFEAGKWDPIMGLKHLWRLPKDQRIVKGDLALIDKDITALPTGLHVKGDLWLSDNRSLEELPSSLKVDGDLYLNGTSITSLPADLNVKGSLYLDFNEDLEELPAGLKVGGNLGLSFTGITSLPAGLEVGGSLMLRNTDITSLPADLQVGSKIYYFDSDYWANVPKHLRKKLK